MHGQSIAIMRNIPVHIWVISILLKGIGGMLKYSRQLFVVRLFGWVGQTKDRLNKDKPSATEPDS
ncbi:hypothetical protein D8Y20_00240 [Mariprofundus sp. EBB-1]|nr:hypothetical protein D8Y20_00240 [Mariprofundus sp. EBB-1]